jgi:hypothetical protein
MIYVFRTTTRTTTTATTSIADPTNVLLYLYSIRHPKSQEKAPPILGRTVAFRRHPSFRNWHDRHTKMDGRAAHQLAPPGGKKDEKVWPNAGSIFCMWDPCPSFARARSQQLSHILSLSFLAWTETGVLVCCALCFCPSKTGCIAPGLLIHPIHQTVNNCHGSSF